MSQDNQTPEVAEETPGQVEGLQKMKSQLTTFLSSNAKTERFHQIFMGVPRKKKIQAESPPIESLVCSWGPDFVIEMLLTGLLGAIAAYLIFTGIGFIFAVINMASGSCGQETWKVSASEACEKLLIAPLLFSFDLRCFNDKPPAMSQNDFDSVCGDPSASITSLVIGVSMSLGIVWNLMEALPVKVNFHDDFFTVESWSGKQFYCSFYADVTHARVSFAGIKITTKAKAKLLAGGADKCDDEDCDCGPTCDKYSAKYCGAKKKGKLLKVKGNSVIKVLAGSGAQKKIFLEKFAQRLPVSINGYQGTSTPSASSASLLDGRVQEILDMRAADASSFKAVRMPITCDFILEAVLTVLCVLIGWYVFTRIFSVANWATNKGQNKCVDPLRPGADMCATWRIFAPIDVPLVNASDYINLVLAIVGILSIPTMILASKPMEYRFHSNGAMQEVLLAGRESQENKVFFSEDIESLEVQNGAMEKCIKMQAFTTYTIKNGVTSFYITAKIESVPYKVMLADPSCAACCGHRQKVCDHKEKVLTLLKEFKPDTLKSEV